VDALMVEYSIPAGRVYRAPDMLADPHFQARQAIIEIETQNRGRIKMQNAFPKLSKSPSSIRRPAPAAPGQDNAEVYGERLGLDAGELERLAAAGVI
jgi:formyl-CoA transferase